MQPTGKSSRTLPAFANQNVLEILQHALTQAQDDAAVRNDLHLQGETFPEFCTTPDASACEDQHDSSIVIVLLDFEFIPGRRGSGKTIGMFQECYCISWHVRYCNVPLQGRD